GTGEVTLWVTSQNPHVHRLIMAAFVLGLPEHKLRVISPDVGGGFGSKIFIYPEECVVTWASRALSRPVKWTAERRESFLADAHGRDHYSDAEMALSADGRILGLRVKTVANMGAYLSLFAPCIPTYLYGTLLAGAYQTPTIHVEVTAGFSTYVEACGLAPSQVVGSLGAQAGLYESATVRVHPTGKVSVFTGSHSHGQGHETTFAQVASDELQLPIEDIEIVHGDTGQVPFGMGSYGSRSAAVGATALYMGTQKIKEKAKKIAAHLLEANEADVVYEGGKFSVKGSPARFKTF